MKISKNQQRIELAKELMLTIQDAIIARKPISDSDREISLIHARYGLVNGAKRVVKMNLI